MTLLAPGVVRAILLTVFATLCGAAMQAISRYLSGDIHPVELVFFRFFFGFIVLTPVFVRHGLAPLRTERLWMHASRSAVQVFLLMMTFTALTMTPLATVAALQFTTPLFCTVLAFLMLGEKIRARRITALAVGFAGTLVIVRPGAGGLDPGALLVLGSSLAFGLVTIQMKVMARTESSLTMTLYLGIFTAPLGLVCALPFWTTPDMEHWPWLIGLGLFGSLANLCFAQALREAEVTAVLPIEFTKLIWSALIGYWAFAEVPSPYTWIGGVMIFASVVYITFRERQLRRRAVAAGATPPPGGD